MCRPALGASLLWDARLYTCVKYVVVITLAIGCGCSTALPSQEGVVANLLSEQARGKMSH